MLDLKSFYDSPAYQLGLLAAYASTEPEVKKNMKFDFLEFPRDRPAEEVVDAIFNNEADLICASNYAWNYKKICGVLDLLAKSGRKLPRIVLGGPNSPGAFGASLLSKYPFVSGLVEGEGEPAFRDICSSLVDSPEKDPLVASRNCVYRDESGEVVRPNLGHRIKYLDEVPSPYLTGLIPAAPSPVFYETNRGCPYRCSYCYWGNGNSKVYRMSIERLREEMEFFAQQRVAAFWIADANFGIFPSDMEIAETMSSINARYRYPFKNVFVNWAKNSSERIMEIAAIFKQGRIECPTTLAVQTVTPEAEEKSKRYSMAPSKFANLISMAYEKKIDTYTDIIWGLPGESVEEHMSCLDAVLSTGVPAIWERQLYLLPGTELFEKRQELGLTMLSEAERAKLAPVGERSEYSDYIVISHPKMGRDDQIRGARLMCINHLFHNHDLGQMVNFYLARHGIVPSMVYDFMDNAMRGKLASFRPERSEFFRGLSDMVISYAENAGTDENVHFGRLGDFVWFDRNGEFKYRAPELSSLMQDFYEVFCAAHGICQEPWEAELLRELVRYNVLISPKPGWKPEPSYTFTYDVHAICTDMRTEIHRRDDASARKRGDEGGAETWPEYAGRVRARLAALLTPEYLASMRRPSRYSLKNPWFLPPRAGTMGWIHEAAGRHCVVSYFE